MLRACIVVVGLKSAPVPQEVLRGTAAVEGVAEHHDPAALHLVRCNNLESNELVSPTAERFSQDGLHLGTRNASWMHIRARWSFKGP